MGAAKTGAVMSAAEAALIALRARVTAEASAHPSFLVIIKILAESQIRRWL
jgi:hypothetical protein